MSTMKCYSRHFYPIYCVWNSFCTDIDDCTPDPCQNGGTCTDGVNDYTCASYWAILETIAKQVRH